MPLRNPQALSSALVTFGLPQPQDLGFLNHVDPSDSASNYHLEQWEHNKSFCLLEGEMWTCCMKTIKPRVLI